MGGKSMDELKEWPLSLLLSAILMVAGASAACIGFGYLLGAGFGWLIFGFLCLLVAQQCNNLYRTERGLDKSTE